MREFFINEILRDYSNNSKDKETLKKLSFYKNETIDKPIIDIGAGTCGLGAGADKTIHKTRQYLADKNINKETLDKAIQTVLNGGNYLLRRIV